MHGGVGSTIGVAIFFKNIVSVKRELRFDQELRPPKPKGARGIAHGVEQHGDTQIAHAFSLNLDNNHKNSA